MCTSGTVEIGDVDVTTLPATDRDVSMVFQSYALFPHMSVIENVSYGLKFSGFKKNEIGERALAGLNWSDYLNMARDCQANYLADNNSG